MKSQQAFFIVYLSKQLKSIKMASIKLGAIVADIKGKLAGNYFAKRKNTTVLAVCGSKLTKADAGRVSLQQQRNLLAFNSSSWKMLTNAQHDLWNSFASTLTWYTKVGIAYTPSGYQVFCQCNLNRNTIYAPFLSEPISPAPPVDASRMQVEFVTGNIMQYSYAGTAVTGKCVVISASAPQSRGVRYPKGGYKRIFVMDAGDVGPQALNVVYEGVFGAVPSSGRVFFKMDLIDYDSGIQEGSKLTKADAGLV